MLNRIINKVKEAHNALVADIKRKSLVNMGAEREARYNREWDARFIAADAAHNIEQGTGSYADWFRQVKAVRQKRNLADAKALH